MFLLLLFLLAAGTACVPLIVRYLPRFFPRLQLYPASAWLPTLAGFLMILSVLLPNIHISNETATFQQHFVGGGMYSAALYFYAKQLFGWRMPWLVDMLAVFSWVSALGVANKLAEFALLKTGLAAISTSDAYWDLLANTLGGYVGYALIFKLVHVPNDSKEQP